VHSTRFESCPALISEAMAGAIEKTVKTPIVAITYDVTGGNKNDVITPYSNFPSKKDKLLNLGAVFYSATSPLYKRARLNLISFLIIFLCCILLW
jgi:hypothetical protein